MNHAGGLPLLHFSAPSCPLLVRSHMTNHAVCCLLLFSGLPTFAGGCQRQEKITSYTIDRSTPRQPPVDAASIARQLDHTLAAILPQGDKAWFFKLVGSAAAVDRHREEFLKFLSSIKLAKTNAEKPTWKLPAGWTEQPGSQMRVATLVVPDKEKKLEIAVSSLPLTGSWQDLVVRNVNRWLGQLQQPALDAATIAKLTQPIATKSGPATLVELVGLMTKRAGGNPHAHMGRTPPSETAQPGKALTYQAPENWLPGRTSAMRKAAFRVVDGDAEAEVTVIDLPAGAGSQITDVAANVRRWAGQVGLAELSPDDLKQLVKPISVDGKDGSYVELIGPDQPEPARAMLAVMLQRQGKVWFFKMLGDRRLVESQRDNFQAFLASIHFH